MKNTRKLFMLGLMLLGIAGVNSKESPREVKAAEPGSYATFKAGELEKVSATASDISKVVKLTITTDPSKFKENPVKGPYEVGSDSSSTTNGYHLASYLYTNAENSNMYDCVIYADVETIYANEDSSYMFYYFENVKEIVFDNFDTSKVLNMWGMFRDCSSLTKLDLSSFNTSNVVSMNDMFFGCSSLTELDVSNFDTKNVDNMYGMFSSCSNLTELDLSKFDTSNVNDMTHMFSGCSNLTELDLSSFDTTNVTSMWFMFLSCSNLKSINLSSFNTPNVTTMESMFEGCSNLTELDISNFDTTNVTSMLCMFYDCSSLTELDLSSFDMGNVRNTYSMLEGMESLQQIKTPKKLWGDEDYYAGIELPNGLMNLSTMKEVNLIDYSMTNMILFAESDDLNVLIDFINAINSLDTCSDYAQAPSLRAQYETLIDVYKEAFTKTKNSDGVLLMNKLEYMEYLLSIKGTNTSDNQMLKTLESNDYSVITIAVLALTSFIGIVGYYFIQKRKNIEA